MSIASSAFGETTVEPTAGLVTLQLGLSILAVIGLLAFAEIIVPTGSIPPPTDERDRSFITGLLHQVMLTVLGATAGVMAVLLLGSSGGPQVVQDIGLYQVLGYNLLIVAVLLGLRVVVTVLRPRS